MLFSDALIQLKDNVQVHRTGWEIQDGYLTLMPGMTHIWKICLHPNPNAGNYIFSVADLEANDWEVYAAVKPPVTLKAVGNLEKDKEVV